MKTIINVLAALLLLTGAGAAYVYTAATEAPLDTVVQNLLLLITTVGALLSALYSLFNNHVAWLSFQDARTPSALFRLLRSETVGLDGVIHYENRTAHDMKEMRVSLTVLCEGVCIDLSGLIPAPFSLPAGDVRDRGFNSHRELAKRGFDLNSALANGAEVQLTIAYSHLVFGRRKRVDDHQIYHWSSETDFWKIGPA